MRLINYIKKFIINIKLSSTKRRWKDNSGLKILISVNDYFNENRWKKVLLDIDKGKTCKWDIVFCKNRFEVYKHFPDADICFLHGFNSKMMITKEIKPKLLYFPFQGLEFLKSEFIHDNFKIEKPSSNSSSVAIAEYCIAMLILLSRNLHFALYNQFNKKWDQSLMIENNFISISSLKIGVLGLGNIGKVTGEYFKKLGCFVAGCDKNINYNLDFIDKWFTLSDLNSFLEFIDVLIVALPLTPETRNLIGFKELKYLGPSSYIINISRGDIINEKDLIAALKNKKIKGAVLDVFSNEPLTSWNKLYKLDNVIITPHIAGNINLFINNIQKDFLLKALKFSENV